MATRTQKTALDKALRAAVEGGDQGELRRLCAQGAEINATDKGGCSAVWLAAWNDHKNCIQALSELGADINICGNDGLSPVYIAVRHNHVDCLRLLGELGADPNKCRTDNGASPVYVAVQRIKRGGCPPSR
jgi:ankyrin repeat protein